MGSDTTPNAIRGFLTEYPLTIDHLWEGQSTYTNADTLPSSPEAFGDYDLGVTASGTFSNTNPIEIKTLKAGNIGTTGFVWRSQGSADYYGRDTANLLSRWNTSQPGTSAATETWSILDSIGIEDGTCLFLAEFFDNGGAKSRSLIVYKKAVDGTITNTTIYTQTSTSPSLYGSFTRLSDGSILVAHMRATSTIVQIQTQRSFDGGSTWQMLSSRCLPTDIDITGAFGAGNTGHEIQKVRIAEAQGDLLLILAARAHNTTPAATDVLLQYMSVDNGGNFFDVGSTDGTVAYYEPEIISKNNQFYLLYITSVDEAEILPLESAVTKIDNAKAYAATTTFCSETIAGGLTNKHFTQGYMSAWLDEDDRLWVVFEGISTQKRYFIQQSDDLKTFFFLGGNPTSSKTIASQIYYINDTASKPTRIAGCSARGTQHLFHNYVTAASAFDNGIHCFELGGWSSINAPYVNTYPTDYDHTGYDFTWVSYDTPDNTAHYTKTGAGTITATATDTEFSTSSIQQAFVSTPGFTSGPSEGVIIRTRLKPVALGELARGRGIQIETTDRKVTCYIDTTGIALYDEYATAQIVARSFDTTGGIELLISVQNNKIKAWYRLYTLGFDKQWILIGTSGTLAAGGPVANTTIRFGHLSTLISHPGLSPLETKWYEFHYSYASRVGNQIFDQVNPEMLTYRKYPPKGQTCYISGGTRISTYDSPGYEGEDYTIKQDSQYPLRRMFHAVSPTPRVTYRSATQASGDIPQAEIAFYWDTTVQNNAETNIGNDSYGIHLNNINFRSFEIFRYDVPTTSWVSEGAFDNSIGGLKAWSRSGSSITCTTANGVYLEHGEATNWTWIVTSGGNTYARRIKSNTAGVLGNPTGTAKTAVLQLEGVQNTDPTTANGYLIPDICTAIIHKLGNQSAAIKIRILAQQNAEKYFKIGSLVVGPLLVTLQYGRGRTISFESGALTTMSQDGVERIRETNKGRRNARIAWTEGIDISSLFDTNPSPDYYTGSTDAAAEPIATPADSPSSLMGLVRYNNGAKRPIVYLPKLTRSASTTELLNRRSNQMLCTIQGDISIENVLGDEETGAQQGEVLRIGTVNLQEII